MYKESSDAQVVDVVTQMTKTTACFRNHRPKINAKPNQNTLHKNMQILCLPSPAEKELCSIDHHGENEIIEQETLACELAAKAQLKT